MVVQSYMERGVAKPVPSRVRACLNANGIYRMVTGHKPVGGSPLVRRFTQEEGGAPTVPPPCCAYPCLASAAASRPQTGPHPLSVSLSG